MAIVAEALAMIEEFEGCLKPTGDGRFKPYLCPAGVPTIGIGSTFYEDRRRVKLSDAPITRERAKELLDFELYRVCVPAIATHITVPLHPLMLGALASFTFNVGTGALQASTLRRRINEQRWADVPGEFRKWCRGGGRVLRGLERRRIAEADMFMRGVAELQAAARQPTRNFPVADQKTIVQQPDTAAPVTRWRRLWAWVTRS